MATWSRYLVVPYFGIGQVFGLLLYGSYLWGGTKLFFGACGFGTALSGSLIAGTLGLLFAILRVLLWLPALLIWLYQPNSTFLQWLFPGAAMACT
jgi:hypothetical protein